MKGPSTIWIGAINNPRDIIDGGTIYNPYIIIHRASKISALLYMVPPSIIHGIL